MKEFVKSKKGVMTIVALVFVIIVLILGVVKYSEKSDKSQKKDKTKTEQENRDDTAEDNGIEWSDVEVEMEEISEGGLISVGGEIGKKHPEDSTDFPNDDVTVGTTSEKNPGDTPDVEGDKEEETETPKDEEDNGTTEEWKGSTLY